MTLPRTEAELEALAAEHATGNRDEDEAAEWTVDDGSTATGSATVTVRLPVSVIAALKRAAEEEGIGATVLARRFITEGLARDPSLDLATTSELLVAVAQSLKAQLQEPTPHPR